MKPQLFIRHSIQPHDVERLFQIFTVLTPKGWKAPLWLQTLKLWSLTYAQLDAARKRWLNRG